MLKKYYLAYGSNLNLMYMQKRCTSSKPIKDSTLKNFRLAYKGSADGFAYLTIEPAIDFQVPLGVFELSYKDIKRLDLYEGYPHLYEKAYSPLQINSKEKEALIYIMQERFTYHLPSKEYIEICKKGYEDFGFDTIYLDDALDYTINQMKKTLKR